MYCTLRTYVQMYICTCQYVCTFILVYSATAYITSMICLSIARLTLSNGFNHLIFISTIRIMHKPRKKFCLHNTLTCFSYSLRLNCSRSSMFSEYSTYCTCYHLNWIHLYALSISCSNCSYLY